MFHRKFLYIVDYLGLIMDMAPRFTEMYATENYYSYFLPTQNKRSSWPWVFKNILYSFFKVYHFSLSNSILSGILLHSL